ncbi:MAG TPA: Cof-type HAD-IIB family hydrolase [Candidatus Limnocylindrales bacterium]
MPEGRFPIRLLALDIDGTIVGDDLVIGERTRRAVREASRRGVAVALVTGRIASSARGFSETLGLTGPLVACQGALIRQLPPPGDPRLGRLLHHEPLPAATVVEICRWAFDQGLEVHLNHLERLVLQADEPRASDYSRFVGGRVLLVPDLLAWVRHPVTKVVAVGEPPRPVELAAHAREIFAGRAEAVVSHPRFLEFLSPGVSKGRAIRWLARRSGVPLEQAMAIGDQYNDLEMIAEVGHGVAMPTAPAEVQAVASYLAPPLGDEGAAAMIEALVLDARPSAGPGRALALEEAR